MKVQIMKVAGAALLASTLLFAPASASNAANAVDDTPAVIDTADVFTPAEEQELTSWFSSIYATRDVVGVVETIDALPGNTDIEEFALARANELGVGEADKGNGVYILISVDDQEARLELGSGVGAVVSDDQAADIMDDDMVPYFQDEEWVTGVQQGVILVAKVYAPTDAELAAIADAQAEREAAAVQAGAFWASFWKVTGFVLLGVLTLAVLVGGIRWFRTALANKKTDVRRRVVDALEKMNRWHEYDQFVSAAGEEERRKVVERHLAKIISPLPKRHQSWLTETFRDTIVTKETTAARSYFLNSEIAHLFRYVDVPDIIRVAGDKIYTTPLRDLAQSTSSVWQDVKVLNEKRREQAKKEEARRAEEARLASIRREKENREKERLRVEAEKSAKKFWDSLSPSEQSRLKSTRNKNDRQRLVQSYGGDMSMVPLWVSLGFVLSSTNSSSSSYSSGGGSYDSSSSFSSSTFSGGSFDGGGASGSW